MAPKRHLFHKIEIAVPGWQQDAHMSNEQGIVRVREPVMEHHEISRAVLPKATPRPPSLPEGP